MYRSVCEHFRLYSLNFKMNLVLSTDHGHRTVNRSVLKIKTSCTASVGSSKTRSSATAEIPERDIGIAIPLLRLTPRQRCFPGTISVKFCTEVKEWLRCKMAEKYCRKFQPLSRVYECHAVVTCEIRLFQNYFSLRRRPSEIIFA